MEAHRVKEFITVDPNVCHGKPCFRGTRIMVASVLELLEAGESTDQIIAGYPSLTPKHIEAALHFAAEAVDSGKFAPAA